MNSTVGRCFSTTSSSASGDGRSTSSVAAPIRSGKSSSPPSPNVNASGGLPVNTSSGVAFSVCFGQQSHAAITSRWKCIVPFGLPVVPDVNAISAVSVASVATSANVAGLPRRPRLDAIGRVGLEQRDALERRARRPREVELLREPGVAQGVRRLALVTMSVSSFARSSGIVATAIAPAFMIANQHAAIIGLLGPRSSTRLPGTTPRSSTSTCAIRFARASSSRRSTQAVGRADRHAIALPARDRAAEQLGGAVHAVRDT